jgi:hypothetical protein
VPVKSSFHFFDNLNEFLQAMREFWIVKFGNKLSVTAAEFTAALQEELVSKWKMESIRASEVVSA